MPITPPKSLGFPFTRNPFPGIFFPMFVGFLPWQILFSPAWHSAENAAHLLEQTWCCDSCPFDTDFFPHWKPKSLQGKKSKPKQNSAHTQPHIFAMNSVIYNFSKCMQRLLDVNWQPWKISPRRLHVWQEAQNYLGVKKSYKVLPEKAACNVQLALLLCRNYIIYVWLAFAVLSSIP